MKGQSDYYETFGLPPTATPEQIKKKYRELARRYHPDVNPSPDASQQILKINQAYHILGDAERRAAYDAERLLRQQNSPPPPRPAGPAPQSPPRTRASARPASAPGGRVEFNGFGRTYTRPEPAPAAPPPRSPSARQAPGGQAAGIERAVAEAKLAFINRQLPQAEQLCREVLAVNPQNATAHEILGDIYLRQGQPERAMTAFSYAIQFNPRNQNVQAKLERLMHAPSRPAAGGPTITYARAANRPARVTPLPDVAFAAITLLAVAALIWGWVLLTLAPNPSMLAKEEGPFGLSFRLLAALSVSGTASGILLAFYGRMRPVHEELWSKGRNGDALRTPVPLGNLLALIALVWFYASFLVYIGTAAARNRFSPSILRAYMATLALIILSTLLYHPAGISSGNWQITLLAGNFLFPALLLGWGIGDAFRLRGRF